MITKKEDLIGTIFNVADEDGGAIVRLAAMFYDVCTKYNIRVMGGNGRDYFMKAVGEGLVNLCIADEDGLGAFGRVSVSKDSVYGGASYSMSDFRYIDESELKSHLVNETPQNKEVEWENGDIAYVKDCTHDEIKFIGLSGNNAVAVCECVTSDRRVILDKFWVSDLLKEKPETPEAKKEREELEAAYDLYIDSKQSMEPCMSKQVFISTEGGEQDFWLCIVRKTGYRLEK